VTSTKREYDGGWHTFWDHINSATSNSKAYGSGDMDRSGWIGDTNNCREFPPSRITDNVSRTVIQVLAPMSYPHTQGYGLGYTADSTPQKATVAGVSKGTRAIPLEHMVGAVAKE
jgi:hypothetical protein